MAHGKLKSIATEALKGAPASRQLFGYEELENRWGVSRFTIRRAVLRGDLRTVNIGARQLVPLSEVERVEREGLGTPRPRKAVAVAEPAGAAGD